MTERDIFSNFKECFRADGKSVQSQPRDWSKERLNPIWDSRLELFFEQLGGYSFNKGLYRTHTKEQFEYWTKFLESMFPVYENQIICFAYDWLGRQWCLKKETLNNREDECVLIFLPCEARVLKVPCDFLEFLNTELTEYTDEDLEKGYYDEWISNGGVAPNYSQCVGYDVPFFLGGEDSIDNQSLSDLDVYWELTKQLLDKTKNLKNNTSINKVTID